MKLRPEILPSVSVKKTTGCGSLYITVTMDDQDSHKPMEVFATLGKAGGCVPAMLEATCRLISAALRSGIAAEEIVSQLINIRCPQPAWSNGQQCLSCPDAIAQAIKQIIEADHVSVPKPKSIVKVKKSDTTACPECGGLLIHQEGCLICQSCGYSKC